MKYLIPYGKEKEFGIFLQENYGIMLSDIDDDVDITDKIEAFVYGKKEEKIVQEIPAVVVIEDRVKTLFLSKMPEGSDYVAIEAIWFEATRKGVGDKIYVVDIITDKTTIRYTLKDKGESMRLLGFASQRITL